MSYLIISSLTADGPAVEGLELDVQVGPRAAKKLLKKINTETSKVRSILQKLKIALEGKQRNNNSSSSRFFNHNIFISPDRSSSHSFSSSSSSNSHLSKASLFLIIDDTSVYLYL